MNNLSSEEFVNNDKGLQCFRKVCINTVKNFTATKRKYTRGKHIPLMKKVFHKKSWVYLGWKTIFLKIELNKIKHGIQNKDWLLLLTLLLRWCKISSLFVVPIPNYWTWTKTTPQKKRFFLSNPYKTEVLITSLIEMLELPNFGHMSTSTI